MAETDAKLTRAYRQINTTSAQIDQRNPAFARIPAEQPRQALIVTLEPFPIANANLPHMDLPVPAIPTMVVSAQEIERLVTLTDITPSSLLLVTGRQTLNALPGLSTNASPGTRAAATRSLTRDGRPAPGPAADWTVASREVVYGFDLIRGFAPASG
ncbi:hypothetical protein [Streptomyces sp. NPDC004528]|uniref:hypothetical protein n=1 Tax=Streptomyces sp. NPDC004528 TaxID=3154550 RepID=UPI0033B33D5E